MAQPRPLSSGTLRRMVAIHLAWSARVKTRDRVHYESMLGDCDSAANRQGLDAAYEEAALHLRDWAGVTNAGTTGVHRAPGAVPGGVQPMAGAAVRGDATSPGPDGQVAGEASGETQEDA